MSKVIWSNIELTFKDWEADLRIEHPDLSDAELEEKMRERNADYLDDERINLDVDVGSPIVVIADLGLWNGRKPGYKLIRSGNISDCLYDSNCEFCEWYCDANGDLRFTGHHHDGTNHYLYRAFKPGTSKEQIDNFCSKIYNGTITPTDISRYTRRLGDEIGMVYGWKFPKKGRRKAA